MFGNKEKKFKRNYVSEIDQFLQELNNSPLAKSDARIEEEQKYERISKLRDKIGFSNSEELLWKDT